MRDAEVTAEPLVHADVEGTRWDVEEGRRYALRGSLTRPARSLLSLVFVAGQRRRVTAGVPLDWRERPRAIADWFAVSRELEPGESSGEWRIPRDLTR